METDLLRVDSALISGLSSLCRARRLLAKTAVVSLLALSANLAGCWSSSTPEPEAEGEAKEIKQKDAADSSDAPEGELVSLAKRLYEAQMYSIARDSLQSLKDRYPLGAYATFAEIKVADSYYFNGEYNEAAKFYEGFMKSYPGSPDLPYVELQAARSHIKSARGTGRDRQPLERGLTILDGIVERYPGTPYATAAKQERIPIIEQLAEYDRLIIDFYQKRENTAAVEFREKQYKERWGNRLSSQAMETPAPLTLKELPAFVPATSTPLETPAPAL